MRDLFFEETSVYTNGKSQKRRYLILNFLSYFCYVLSILIACVFVFFPKEEENFLITCIVYLIFFIAFIVVGIILSRKKDKYAIDFDYTFVSGSVRISKVIRNKKRYKLTNFETSDIVKIGLINSEYFNKLILNKELNIVYATCNEEPTENRQFYYFFISNSKEKSVYILDCSKEFLSNVMQFTSRLVLEENK